jgi:hypothetical protein
MSETNTYTIGGWPVCEKCGTAHSPFPMSVATNGSLVYDCPRPVPTGWKRTEDEAKRLNIVRALMRSGGFCPCVPRDEWSEDTFCPCRMLREGNGCHCGLYVPE